MVRNCRILGRVTHEWVTKRMRVSETVGHKIRVEEVAIVVCECSAQTALCAHAVADDEHIVWQPTDDERYCNG